MSDENHPAFVGFCQSCGGINACCVDDADHKRDTAKFCGEIIRRGDTLERKTVGFVRTSARENWCTCNKKKRAVESEQLEATLG
jgi:hypothetical protein